MNMYTVFFIYFVLLFNCLFVLSAHVHLTLGLFFLIPVISRCRIVLLSHKRVGWWSCPGGVGNTYCFVTHDKERSNHPDIQKLYKPYTLQQWIWPLDVIFLQLLCRILINLDLLNSKLNKLKLEQSKPGLANVGCCPCFRASEQAKERELNECRVLEIIHHCHHTFFPHCRLIYCPWLSFRKIKRERDQLVLLLFL